MFKPKDFDKAQIGNYMKFEDGENKIRILDTPITGYVYWEDAAGNRVGRNEQAGKGGKPVRTPDFSGFDNDKRGAMRGFTAMKVWNYNASKVQILEIKQVHIINALEVLSISKSWGDVTKFDIIINRKRTGTQPMDVEYSVVPEPKEELSKEIKEEYKKVSIDLDALFKGEDPFGSSEEKVDLEDLPEDLDLDD